MEIVKGKRGRYRSTERTKDKVEKEEGKLVFPCCCPQARLTPRHIRPKPTGFYWVNPWKKTPKPTQS